MRGHLVEKGARGGLNTVCVAAKINSVKIHGKNLLFGVIVLEFHSHYPFFELGVYETYLALAFAREEVFCQLLCYGAAAATAAVASYKGLEKDTGQTAGVDAGMVVETHILGGDKGMDEVHVLPVVSNLTVCKIGPVLQADIAKHHAIGRPYLGSQVAARVLKLLE